MEGVANLERRICIIVLCEISAVVVVVAVCGGDG